MSKALVIAEKPSVASDIAKALGGFEKKDDLFERDDMVISSAVGHLLEIVAPEKYEVKRGKWSFAHLPVIPPEFDLQPLPKSEQKLKVIAKQIKRKDIDHLINACDAGREGELIFRYIVQHTKARQPVSRLWLQSMTPDAIRKAFESLRPDQDLLPLADAARCRSEADWLVGINGTRAMTAFNSKEGGFFLTTVGRVQTPTLAVVVEREEQIRAFVAKTYWELHAKVGLGDDDEYIAKWFDPAFKRSDENPEHRAERIWSREKLDALLKSCADQVVKVNDESKPSTQAAPALFDLTSLQREANARFGFSAKNTLGIAQALYEKHKVLTYPRTDSKALPEDMIETVKANLAELKKLPVIGGFAETILEQQWVRPNKRVFDNSKVSDHFAIVPTGQLPKSLSEPEQRIFELVTRRFLAIFFPAAEYLNTTRLTQIGPELFKTDGKILVTPGWLTVYGKEETDNDRSLPAVNSRTPELLALDSLELKTKPPARYSEATLLSAMEGAGKLVEDDDLREAMAGKGLGTPATRAAVIEGLLAEKYLLREQRELIPTAKAFQLMTLLRGLGIDALSRPELTGDWEFKLRQIEAGGLTREEFMQEIARMTDHMVEQAKNYNSTTIPGDYASLKTPCPRCDGLVRENYRRFACEGCDFSISKVPGGRTFEVEEVETLLRERQLGPMDGFRSKMGRPFAASLRLTSEHKLEFDFGQGSAEGDAEAVDFSGQTSLGPCPKCGSAVFSHGSSYVCEKSVGPSKTCDFRSGLMILQQSIAAEQMQKLLNEGRTDLLDGFVSARTKRRFKAYLVKTDAGKVGFEFEAKKPKGPGAKVATKTSKVAKSKSK